MRKTIVSLILIKGNKILVGKRRSDRLTDPGKTLFPGGHVKPGEELQDAIIREAKEELDVTLLNPKLAYTSDFNGPEEKQRLYWFFCTEYIGTPKALEDEELYWIDKNDLNQLSYQVSIDAVKASFKLTSSNR